MRFITTVTSQIECDDPLDAVVRLYSNINRGSVNIQAISEEGTIYIINPITEKVIKIEEVIYNLHIDTVFKTVCRVFSTTREELKNRTRRRDVLVPRQWFFYLASTLTKRWSLEKIGEYIESARPWDHATVLHAKRTIANMMATDRQYLEDYAELMAIMRVEHEKWKDMQSKNKKSTVEQQY